MPHSVTIRRARSVAFSMSLLAPVVVSPKIEPLGRVATEQAGDLVLELGLGLEIAVLHGSPWCSRGPCRG
jgi:hypothetical protein